jgi:dTDP-4-dehydrorhamnose 3,5-epimerase
MRAQSTPHTRCADREQDVKFTETALQGAYIVDVEPIEDERGFFARSWCREEFGAHGLHCTFVQSNISFNTKKGTLRGMHYQVKPNEETKLVRCTRGAIYDVIIDLRSQSRTCTQWIAVELTAVNHRMVYVPEGFAHGFQTLEDDTEVLYLMSAYYRQECSRGVRWDDPAFGIAWPQSDIRIISDKDKAYPDFQR